MRPCSISPTEIIAGECDGLKYPLVVSPLKPTPPPNTQASKYGGGEDGNDHEGPNNGTAILEKGTKGHIKQSQVVR